MKRKVLAIILALVVFCSLITSVYSLETPSSAAPIGNILVSVVEKDLETNIIEAKTYSRNSDGISEVEITDEWIDDTASDNLSNFVDSSTLQNELRSIIGDSDGRTVVSNTRVFPYSAIVQLDIYFGLSAYRGTGFLIDDNIVATAGHCLYDEELGWATAVYVRPGRNGLLGIPFGIARSKRIAVSTEWHLSADSNYDWGAICIYDTLIGNPGSFTMTSVNDNSSNIQAKISGYPQNVGSSSSTTYKQYEMDGPVNILSMYRLYYTIDTSGGQSGAPILNSNNVVIGIHTSGSTSYNTGVRMTPQVLFYLTEFIANYG